MRDGEVRAKIVRFYQDEAQKAKAPVTFALGEGEDTPVTILDFQILAEIPAEQITRHDNGDEGVSLALKRASFT